MQNIGLMRLSVAFLLTAMGLTGCSDADTKDAWKALEGRLDRACLSKAHWVAVQRNGAFTQNPLLGGFGFTALDRSVPEKLNLEWLDDYFFAVILVDKARTVLGRPLATYESSYITAGQPMAKSSNIAEKLAVGRELLHIDHQIDAGWIRGVASGWLSRESNLYCGTDVKNGRYFVIKNFVPSFPIGPR